MGRISAELACKNIHKKKVILKKMQQDFNIFLFGILVENKPIVTIKT